MDIGTDSSISRIDIYRYASGYRYRHGHTHRHRLNLIYLGRITNSFSVGGGCLNVALNTNGPYKYL